MRHRCTFTLRQSWDQCFCFRYLSKSFEYFKDILKDKFQIDLDNLIIGMKCTLGGIVDSGLIEDDSPSKVKLEAEFSLCKKNEKKTLITLVEI